MLMQNHQIRNVIRSACFRQLLHDVVTTVKAGGVGKDQAHLLYGHATEAFVGQTWSRIATYL